jgi:HEPN domain-containing protein
MATPADLARQLLAAAENDELMARSLLPIEEVADAGIGFHTQQAVEKAIKAVLAAKGVRFPFVHDLERLRDVCDESEIELPATLAEIEELTPFAVAERYGSLTPMDLDRDQALAWAAAAVAWAQSILASLTGPTQTPPPSH